MYYVGNIPAIESDIKHHGIKGQQWGVRNGPPYPLSDQNKQKSQDALTIKSKTSKGETVTMGERPTPKFTQFLSKYFPKIKDNVMRDKQFNINVEGKRIGDLEIFKESENSLNVVWVSVDDSERGKGYGTAVMKGVIKYAKNQKFKQITLEVPGNSPDARHIYEKLGFKATKVISDESDVWGGLTAMVLNIEE